jgi:hypothetical protein
MICTRRLLTSVVHSEGFESFLSTKFPSAKRFGLEGGETLIPGNNNDYRNNTSIERFNNNQSIATPPLLLTLPQA